MADFLTASLPQDVGEGIESGVCLCSTWTFDHYLYAGRELRYTYRAIVFVILLFTAYGQQPKLLKDINQDVNSYAGVGFEAVVAGDNLFFSGSDIIHGRELWITDESPIGATMIEDMAPGGQSFFPRNLTAYGDLVLFTAPQDRGLYSVRPESGKPKRQSGFKVYDGSNPIVTSNSAVYVQGFRDDLFAIFLWSPGVQTADMQPLVDENGMVLTPMTPITIAGNYGYFLVYESFHGQVPDLGLHAVPLGESVTVRLHGFSGHPNELEFIPQQERMVFRIADEGRLWRTDGTRDGTHEIQSDHAQALATSGFLVPINGGAMYFISSGKLSILDETLTHLSVLDRPYPSRVRPLITVGEYLYFLAGNGAEIWMTNGTTEGTMIVPGVLPRPGLFDHGAYKDHLLHGRHLYIALGRGNQSVAELWAIDTATNKAEVILEHGWISQLESYNNEVHLIWSSDRNGSDWWKIDARGNMTRVTNILSISGNGPSFPNNFERAHDSVYFTATGSGNKRCLWKTDGTSEGTAVVRELPGHGNPVVTPTPDGLYFFESQDGQFGSHLYYTERESWNPIKVDDGLTEPISAHLVGNQLAFPCKNGLHYQWCSTEIGGSGVSTFGRYGSNLPSAVAIVKDQLFFSAERIGNHGRELFVTNGTSQSTRLVKNINTRQHVWRLQLTTVSSPRDLPNNGRNLLFLGRQERKISLYIFGKTASSLTIHEITEAGATNELYRDLMNVIGTSWDTIPSLELEDAILRILQSHWGAGVSRERFEPFEGSSDPRYGIAFDNTLYFFADDGIHGRELWRSDGTEEGTWIVKDIFPGESSSTRILYEQAPVLLSPYFYFAAHDGLHGRRLWRSDGTTEGTQLFSAVPFVEYEIGHMWKPYDGDMYFTIHSSPDPTQDGLWRTDGTTDGTVFVSSQVPRPSTFVHTDSGEIVFSDYSGGLWRSDGTLNGTISLFDKDETLRVEDEMVALQSRVLFVATDPHLGSEPYVIDLSPLSVWASKELPAQHRALSDDPDRDGWSNLIEYALMGDPNKPDSDLFYFSSKNKRSTNREIIFVRDVNREDVRIELQSSPDLTAWHTDVVISKGVIAGRANEISLTDELRQVRVPVGSDSSYLRFEISTH